MLASDLTTILRYLDGLVADMDQPIMASLDVTMVPPDAVSIVVRFMTPGVAVESCPVLLKYLQPNTLRVM